MFTSRNSHDLSYFRRDWEGNRWDWGPHLQVEFWINAYQRDLEDIIDPSGDYDWTKEDIASIRHAHRVVTKFRAVYFSE